MTGYPSSVPSILEYWLLFCADLLHFGASVVEPAARRKVYRVGDLALDDGPVLLNTRFGIWYCYKQCLSVGVQGSINEHLNIDLFHKLPQIHNPILPQMCLAVARSWVMYRYEMFSSSLSRNMRFSIEVLLETSSIYTGSSATMMSTTRWMLLHAPVIEKNGCDTNSDGLENIKWEIMRLCCAHLPMFLLIDFYLLFLFECCHYKSQKTLK